MRGALHVANILVSLIGIIPAYAGSTELALRCFAPIQDHPRVCGEHSVIPYYEFFDAGSSPRMRGALRREREEVEHPGIIPAYAGST